MAYRLPPLNNLRLFEAAGRHQSFKRAAQELGITASAVSHGIQALEDWLGVALFLRTSRGLALSEPGAHYLLAARETLTSLAKASERIPRQRPSRSLSMSVSPTFAARLLLPRLPRFMAMHPALRLEIDTSFSVVEFPRDGFDFAIRLGKGAWPGLAATALLPETLVPVCSPQLRDLLGPAPALCDARLIHLTTVTEDWESWAAATGRGTLDCRRGLMVDTIEIAIDAAVQGLGVALGRRPIVDRELSAGSLVTLGLPAITATTCYWLTAPPEVMTRLEIASFARWLHRELADLTHASAATRHPDAAAS
jgi:DNA-binding transcriptional LysR family regulator